MIHTIGCVRRAAERLVLAATAIGHMYRDTAVNSNYYYYYYYYCTSVRQYTAKLYRKLL